MFFYHVLPWSCVHITLLYIIVPGLPHVVPCTYIQHVHHFLCFFLSCFHSLHLPLLERECHWFDICFHSYTGMNDSIYPYWKANVSELMFSFICPSWKRECQWTDACFHSPLPLLEWECQCLDVCYIQPLISGCSRHQDRFHGLDITYHLFVKYLNKLAIGTLPG